MGNPTKKVLFWDFHGTLTYPDSLWSLGVFQTAQEQMPQCSLTYENCRTHLENDRFPWHHPEKTYLELTDPEIWWFYINRLFVHTYLALGLERRDAERLAPLVREKIIDPARFRLYEGVPEALRLLSQRGWHHVLLSNNFPELEPLCGQLGMARYFDDFVVSALVGYDKPRKEIFELALQRAGSPDYCFMIGDNPAVDALGAKQAGIPCILLHAPESATADYRCDSLDALIALDVLQ